MESNIINSYMNLTLSDNAYKHIGNLLEQHSKKYVRLEVKGGGCAGFVNGHILYVDEIGRAHV